MSCTAADGNCVSRCATTAGQLMLRFLNFYSSQIKQMAVGRRFRIFGLVRGGLAGD